MPIPDPDLHSVSRDYRSRCRIKGNSRLCCCCSRWRAGCFYFYFVDCRIRFWCGAPFVWRFLSGGSDHFVRVWFSCEFSRLLYLISVCLKVSFFCIFLCFLFCWIWVVEFVTTVKKMYIEELKEGDSESGEQQVCGDLCEGAVVVWDPKRLLVGAGARALFYPTLLYNVVRNKIQSEFRWWDRVDEVYWFQFSLCFLLLIFMSDLL